jgi:hypothetical protein
MVERLRQAVGDLQGAEASALQLLGRTRSVAKSFALDPAAVLCGVLGFGVGVAVGCGLGLVLPSLAIIAPSVLGLMGLPLGILIARGPQAFKLERDVYKLEILRRLGEDEAASVLRQLKALPRSAPAAVRDELWGRYARVVTTEPAQLLLTKSSRPLALLPAPEVD